MTVDEIQYGIIFWKLTRKQSQESGSLHLGVWDGGLIL